MSAITCPSCQRPVALTAAGPTNCPHCGAAFPVFAAPTARPLQDKPVAPQPPDPFQPPATPKQDAVQPAAAAPKSAKTAPPVPPVPATPVPAPSGRAPEQPVSAATPAYASERTAPVAKPIRRERRSVTVQVPSGAAILDFFDLSFQKYLTPLIVKITWVVTLVMACIWLLVLTLGLFGDLLPDGGEETSYRSRSSASSIDFVQQAERFNSDRGSIQSVLRFVRWLTGIVSAFIGCLWVRVGLECVIVFFNISATLKDIKQDLQSQPDR